MKRILVTGVIAAVVAGLSAPAQADLKMDLGGYFREYAVYNDNDETGTATLRSFNFFRDNEIHFNGETTTANGLTVGTHSEWRLGDDSRDASNVSNTGPGKDPNAIDETYVYFSGDWGRINLGNVNGAAWLLQVSAPAADSNIDGIRVNLQGINPDTWDDRLVNGTFPAAGGAAFPFPLNYDVSDFRRSERIDYITPKWNGFQAAVSYAPANGQQDPFGGTFGLTPDNRAGKFEHLWEASARWDGNLDEIHLGFGGGYSGSALEASKPAGTFGSDDFTSWDAGLRAAYHEWSLGGAYKHTETGVSGPDADLRVWVLGAAWDKGPWHAGASWYNIRFDSNAFGFGLADDIGMNRYTVGGGFTFAPGATFRGTVMLGTVDNGTNSATDPRFTQITLGTDIAY